MRNLAKLVAEVQTSSPLPPFAELDSSSRRYLEREANHLGADAEEHYERSRQNREAEVAEADEIASIIANIRRR